MFLAIYLKFALQYVRCNFGRLGEETMKKARRRESGSISFPALIVRSVI